MSDKPFTATEAVERSAQSDRAIENLRLRLVSVALPPVLKRLRELVGEKP